MHGCGGLDGGAKVTAADVIHAVVLVAKANAFMPADAMTVPRMCRPRPAGDLLAQVLARGCELRGPFAWRCLGGSPVAAYASRSSNRTCRHPALGQDLTLRARHTCDCRSTLGAAKMPGAITTILHNSTTAVALSYDRLGGI